MTNTQTYELPFDYPEDGDRLEVIKIAEKHSIEIDAQTSWNEWPGEFIVAGTFPNLVEFFQELDGPAQSFPVDELWDEVMHYNRPASE